MAIDYEALAKEFGGVPAEGGAFRGVRSPVVERPAPAPLTSAAPTAPAPLAPLTPATSKAPIDYEAMAAEFGGKLSQESITPAVENAGGAAFGVYPRTGVRTSLTETKKPVEISTAKDFTELDKVIEAIKPAREFRAVPTEAQRAVTGGMRVRGQVGMPLETPDKAYAKILKDKITPEIAAKSPEVVSFMDEYMKTRYPNKLLSKNPTELATQFRDSFIKDTVGLLNDHTWSLNATPEQKQIAVKGLELSKEMSGDFEKELVSGLKDPINYAGGVAGWAVKQSMLRGTKSLAKIQLTSALTAGGTGGSLAGGMNIVEQKTQINLGLRDEISYLEAATNMILVGATEALTTGSLVASGGKKTSERIAKLKAEKGSPELFNKATEDFKNEFIKKEKEITSGPLPLYESAVARQEAREATLDVISPPTDVTQAVLSKEVTDGIFKVARELFTTVRPDLRPNLNEVRTVQGIVDALTVAGSDDVQQAAARAGVAPADFLEMFKVKASEAGAFLQQAKSTADMLRKMTDGDPVLEDAFKRMINAGAGTEYLSGTILSGAKAFTGRSVATSVLGFSTNVTNAIGLVGTVGIQTAGDTIEAVMKSAGRMVNDMRGNGVPINATRVKEEIGQIFADSTYLISRLIDAGYTKELTDLATKNNPSLRNLLSNAGAEYGKQGVGTVDNILQTLSIVNRSVDAVVRNPTVIYSLKNRMKAVGLDYEDFIANDKIVPLSVAKAAAEDAMKLTMSYDFKKTGEFSIEGGAESLAFFVLDIARKNAGVGIAKDFGLPFLRFQLNAVRYAYRMTPASTLGGIQELVTASKLRSQGKMMEAAGVSYDAKRKILDSVIGTAAIIGAAAISSEDSDLKYYQTRDDDGNIVDRSNIFPYAQIRAMGEVSFIMKQIGAKQWYVLKMTPEERAAEASALKQQANALDANDPKRSQLIESSELIGMGRVRDFDGAKFTEIMAGMGRSAGVQKTILEQGKEILEGGITASVESKAGRYVGDFVGRFDNFFNPIFDGVNFLRDDMRVVDARASLVTKDATGKMIPSGTGSPFIDTAVSTVVAPIPVARDILQSRPSLFQTTEQQVPVVERQFTGTRPTVPTTAIENELNKVGIEPFRVMKTTGNRDWDNIRIELARPEFIAGVTELIQSPLYKKQYSVDEKKTAIETKIASILNASRADALEVFKSRFGDKAIDVLYEKAPNKKSQENAFYRQYKRMPNTPEDKIRILEKEFNIAEEESKARGGLVARR